MISNDKQLFQLEVNRTRRINEKGDITKNLVNLFLKDVYFSFGRHRYSEKETEAEQDVGRISWTWALLSCFPSPQVGSRVQRDQREMNWHPHGLLGPQEEGRISLPCQSIIFKLCYYYNHYHVLGI